MQNLMTHVHCLLHAIKSNLMGDMSPQEGINHPSWVSAKTYHLRMSIMHEEIIIT